MAVLAPSQLLKWWAQYAESNARFREALQYYERAGDHLAIVRVLCFHKKFERAAEVVANTNNLGAAYHLAKQYEAKGVRSEHHQKQSHGYVRAWMIQVLRGLSLPFAGHEEGDPVLSARGTLQSRDPARAPT